MDKFPLSLKRYFDAIPYYVFAVITYQLLVSLFPCNILIYIIIFMMLSMYMVLVQRSQGCQAKATRG